MANDQTIKTEPTDSLSTGCLIIGAGLAGCTLGYLLRRAGVDVLLLEIHEAEKKDKLCAGAMEVNTMELLSEIFGSGAEEALHPARFYWRRSRIEGREIRTNMQGKFLSLPRKRLDDYVLNNYLAEGGRLLDRVSVKTVDAAAGEAVCNDLRTGRSFTVRFETVVGADGAASATRRLITGKMPEVVAAMEAEVQKVSDEILFEYRFGRVGYSWYIPTDEGATIGAGFLNSTPAFCREILQSFLKEISMDVDPRTLRGAFLPTGNDILLCADKNAFFIGDAAGLIDPTLGAGIYYAMISAQCLAKSLLGEIGYEDAMHPWTDIISRGASRAMKQQFINNLSVYIRGMPAEPLF